MGLAANRFISRGNERVSPETSGETQSARTIPPPPISTCSLGGNFPPPDAGIPSPAVTGGGRFAPPAGGFRAEQNYMDEWSGG